MNESSDQTEYDKHYVGDFREGADPDVNLLNRPYSFVNTLLDELFLKQFPYYRYLTRKDINDEYKCEVEIEHRYYKDKRSIQTFGDGEYDVGEIPVVGYGNCVVLD